MFTKIFILFSILVLSSSSIFSFNSSHFLLDNEPFTIRSGELHYARIPPEYWTHRLKLAKAMGLNAISVYIFWNFHQPSENIFDFESPTHDLSLFLTKAKEEGLYVLLRPGPYACAEWDFGGLPHWLLKYDDLDVRKYNSRFMIHAEKYIRILSKIIMKHQINNGGSIILLQIENEYGSYGNDRKYIDWLQALWISTGIQLRFYTADGASTEMLKSGHVKGGAIGLDSGLSVNDYNTATALDPTVVSFSSETYPGWLTHWGENWAQVSSDQICSEIKFILGYGKSFSLYMLHGGSNFGFWAGANYGDYYQPHITSYDYDAPIGENGRIGEKYYGLKHIISQFTNESFPDPPLPIQTIEIKKINLNVWSSLWNNLPNPKKEIFPKNIEYYDQFSGVIIYKHIIKGDFNGKLEIKGLADYGLVFLDDIYIGVLDRTKGIFELDLGKHSNKSEHKLEIIVEAMGRINFGNRLMDKKGIIGNVTLDNVVLINWEIFNFALEEKNIENIEKSEKTETKEGIFFKGKFNLENVGDTFFDVSQWKKGILYINGHNLGRYWERGPQYRLYCPASYLKKGDNSIILLDFHQKIVGYVEGKESLKN